MLDGLLEKNEILGAFDDRRPELCYWGIDNEGLISIRSYYAVLMGIRPNFLSQFQHQLVFCLKAYAQDREDVHDRLHPTAYIPWSPLLKSERIIDKNAPLPLLSSSLSNLTHASLRSAW
jgi:hypothetical protein